MPEPSIYSIFESLKGALEAIDTGAGWTKGAPGLSRTTTESRARMVFWGVRPVLSRHRLSSAIYVMSV
jgi:hypothetical protein